MRRACAIIILLVTITVNAQPGKEASNWWFGYKCKVDFGASIPIVGSTPILSYEASACISDTSSGQLLFYSNGTRVYNQLGNVMNNGFNISGNLYSSQGALIVPWPGSSSKYYLFTPGPSWPTNTGVRYSVIDMSMQGGLGAVTLKNKLLCSPPTCEKITAVRNCTGTGYWVIIHSFNSNNFLSYQIDFNGLDTIPVISSVGSILQLVQSNSWWRDKGCIKASPNGKKIALTTWDSTAILEIYDFNNNNGQVSNPLTINYSALYNWGAGPYGLSFSPDSKLLYASFPERGTLFQYNISSNNLPLILASETTIYDSFPILYSGNPGAVMGLQLAPNGKIYVSLETKDTLGVVNNPNGNGLNCNFQLSGLVLQPMTYAHYGLPNFIDANYAGIQLNVPDAQQCNTFTVATMDAGPGYSSYQWSTGATTQTISVTSPGQYWVTVTNDQGCQRTDTVGAYVLVGGKTDTLACDMFHANVTQGGVLQYNWYDNSNNPIYDFTNTGVYWVDIAYVTGCGIRDSFDVTVVPSPQIDIGPDSTFCKGNLLMNAICSTCNYLWSTGATTPSIVATTAGNYWVNVTDAYGCKDTDTLVVKPELAAFDFKMPNIVTPNDDNINDVIDFGKYQFAELQIDIFNRWGQKIFTGSTPDAIWKPAVDDGTYFYTAKYRIDCGADTKTKEIQGFITVVK